MLQTLKNDAPSAIISGITANIIEKFILGHNLYSTDKFLGINMPKWANTFITVSSSSVIGELFSGYAQATIPTQVSKYAKPLLGGISVVALNGINGSNTNLLNSFGEGATSIFTGQIVNNNLLKKKSR